MKDNSVVFIKLEVPLHLRRELLEGAIDTAEILKSMERVHELQEQKLRYWEKLRITANKIRSLNSQLFGSLPQVSLPKPKKQPEPKEISKPSEIKELRPKPIREKKESPIHKELENIRRKLENLKI